MGEQVIIELSEEERLVLLGVVGEALGGSIQIATGGDVVVIRAVRAKLASPAAQAPAAPLLVITSRGEGQPPDKRDVAPGSWGALPEDD